jgi:hypothetical protein
MDWSLFIGVGSWRELKIGDWRSQRERERERERDRERE